MQFFTPIGITVAEISVTGQKHTADLISDKTYTSVLMFVDNEEVTKTNTGDREQCLVGST